MRLNTYLNFDGDCEAAFKFYEQCLGGRIVAMMRFGDVPEACGPISPESRNLVMHARLEIGDQALMGTDCTPEQPYEPVKCAYVVVDVDTPAEAERLFAALSGDGKVEMPIQETFWAQRYGITTDRFGVPWMVNCARPA